MKKLLLVICCILTFGFAFLFVACNNTPNTYDVQGAGIVIEHKDENDNVISYQAQPEEWNHFAGWYDGERLYSQALILKVDSNTPKNITAVFTSSSLDTSDRFLNAFYNSYDKTVDREKDYLNFEFAFDMVFDSQECDRNIKLLTAGYIDFENKIVEATSILKEDNNTLATVYYTDDNFDSNIYLQIGEEKFSYQDQISLSKCINIFPQLENKDFETLINSDTLFDQIEQYFGQENSLQFVKSVENLKNSSQITLNLNKILDFLKDFVKPNLEDEGQATIKKLIDIFTKEYPSVLKKLPEITLEVNINFEKVGDNEFIDAITAKINIAEEYRINIGQEIILPKSQIDISSSKFEIEFEDEKDNVVENDLISSFPEVIQPFNLSVAGEMDFVYKNPATLSKTIKDKYSITFDSEINSHAIINAYSNGNLELSKVDWNSLGLLSLNISLKDTTDISKHNGQTEYLNLLIDSENFGPYAFLYVGLYNSHISGAGVDVSKDYILNHAFYLPQLVKNQGVEESGDEVELLLGILAQSMQAVLNASQSSDNNLFNKIMFEFLDNLLIQIGGDELQGCAVLTQDGIEIDLDNAKVFVEDKLSQINQLIGATSVQNNIFGKDSTHIYLNFSSIKYGKVSKDLDGDYINAKGQKIAELYNQKHRTMHKIDSDVDVDEITEVQFTKQILVEKLNSIVGTKIVIDKAILNNGEEITTMTNGLSQSGEIKMSVYSYEILQEDEEGAQVRFYLTFANTTLEAALVKQGISCGLYSLDKMIVY